MTQEKSVATQIMFAVRRALSQPEALKELVAQLTTEGVISGLDPIAPLDFVAQHPEVSSLVEAAYRYCRHEPGADVILTGTGNADHLEANVASILSPKLPSEVLAKLNHYFGQVDSVSGN
jgi:aryl-alcohol dehydrogenase-like predicted oxidoreductase